MYFVKNELLKRTLKYLIIMSSVILSINLFSLDLDNNHKIISSYDTFCIATLITSVFVLMEIFSPSVHVN